MRRLCIFKMAQTEEESKTDQEVVVAEEAAPAEETTVEAAPASSTLYPSWVRTLKEADAVLHRFENNTKSRFCVWRSPKDFGHAGFDKKKKKIYWNDFGLEYREKEQLPKGTPFILMGKKIFDCHHGKDRSLAMKRRAEQRRQELNEKKKRNLSSPGKKINCPAQVVFNEVVIFPTYKVAHDSQYSRKQGSRTLKSHFAEGGLIDDTQIDRRIYICLPGEKEHIGHLVGEGCDACERMHNKVADKITALVCEGVTGTKEMKRRLDIFVRIELCPELWKPCHTNKRYFPTKGVIRNKMYNDYIKRRLAMIDQDQLSTMVNELQEKNADDKYFLRQYSGVDEFRLYAATGISVEEELEDELKIRQQIAKQQFIFVHQTSFQIHLMQHYGNHLCFLDPAYRTLRYALPMYFIMVKTNVDYQVVATIVIQDESRASIKEALEMLKTCNPQWEPKIFLCDNDAEEIAALNEVFEECKVFISAYHRLQSWERWLSQTTNDVTPYKDAILNRLRMLADATSQEAFNKSFQSLESSEVWNDTFGKMFRCWFENTWLTVKQYWVWAFQSESFTQILSTNNTVEWQSKDFTHELLHGHGDKLLSEMIKLLVEIYLPAKRDSYCELNAEISATSKYNNLPDFFRNRPRYVIDHITERITSSYEIFTDDITVHSYKEGEFLVNCRRSDVEYRVQFGSAEKLPHCECEDWARNMLPCKHFVAIMRDFKEWSWSRFPESYRSSPYLTLDAIVNPSVPEPFPTATEDTQEATDDGMVSVLDSSQFHELMMPKVNGKSKSGSCRELLNDINNFTYMLSDDDVINRLNGALEKVLTDMKLSYVDDEVIIIEELIEKPIIKREETTPKRASHSSKKSKRAASCSSNSLPIKQATEQVAEELETSEPAKKAQKLDSDVVVQPDNTLVTDADTTTTATTTPATTTYTATETIEEPVLEEMNHMEILNMECYRSLNNHGTSGNAEEQTASGNQEPKGTTTNSDTQEEGSVSQEPSQENSQESGTQDLSCQVGNTTSPDSAMFQPLDPKKGEIDLSEVKSPNSLPKYEARLVQRREMLTVDSINLAQNLLHDMFPALKGLQTVYRGAVQAFEPVSGDFIQILHDGNLHWVCTSNVALGVNKDPAAVSMYDSMNQGFIAKFTKQQLASFLCIQSAEMKVIMRSVQQQNNTVDCGVFAIAFATGLAFGQDPCKQRFDVPKMRAHLVECLKSKQMSPFPREVKEGAGDDVLLSKRKFFTIELFCSCRMPYEKPKSEADLMAQCGSCKEWFHQRCEKIALEIFKASGMNFFCSACLKKVQV